ncbi:T9SS type A sorting domain-containing protein [Flavobacterium sp.]|uniref:T9SS type A sorting domain-containing protein n=1 Tax=Flavobacterium sp. TaxID=239 RepID=UPI0037536341
MKKLTILLLLSSLSIFAQQKTSGTVTLQPNMTANFTLDNATSKVTLILTGPSDRWFGIGIGINQPFAMGAGDVLVYTTSLTDRRFVGTQAPAVDASPDWTVVSDNASGGIRTLNLTRALTNGDTTGSDFQMPYATTNSFGIVGVRAATATTTIAPHGGNGSGGYGTASFTTLGVEDFSLNATQVYPNPSNGSFTVKTKTGLDKINVYSNTGTCVKTINVNNADASEVDLRDLSTGVYLLELLNSNDKSWKKIIVD